MRTEYSKFPNEPVNFRGLRMAGARLMAGLLFREEASRVMRVTFDSYLGVECGIEATDSLLRRASEAYAVSEDYLRHSEGDTERENFCFCLSYALAECRTDWLDAAARGRSLTAMRLSAGYETLEEAAREFGLNPLHVRAHERGVRPVDPEQLAGYALVYGRDPIYVLYGREHLGGVSPDWWRRRTPSDFIKGRWSAVPRWDRNVTSESALS